MICVFFLFCSTIVNHEAIYPNQVYQFLPNVLTAHNFADGQYFSELEPGNMIRYYDGAWKDYRVTEVLQMQAVPPDSPRPLLDGHSVEWVYNNIYSKDLVLQTCVKKGNNWTWGRLFVIAEEVCLDC